MAWGMSRVSRRRSSNLRTGSRRRSRKRTESCKAARTWYIGTTNRLSSCLAPSCRHILFRGVARKCSVRARSRDRHLYRTKDSSNQHFYPLLHNHNKPCTFYMNLISYLIRPVSGLAQRILAIGLGINDIVSIHIIHILGRLLWERRGWWLRRRGVLRI